MSKLLERIVLFHDPVLARELCVGKRKLGKQHEPFLNSRNAEGPIEGGRAQVNRDKPRSKRQGDSGGEGGREGGVGPSALVEDGDVAFGGTEVP